MKTSFDCVTCFVRQALEAARMSSEDPSFQERVMKDVFKLAAELDFAGTPPSFAQKIHKRLRELAGNGDPYRRAKQSFNRLALELCPEAEKKVAESTDPFEVAVKFAIAGNIIDSGAKASLSAREIRETLAEVMSTPLVGDSAALKKAAAEAGSILYLADNAGEIVFDRLLIKLLPMEKMVVAVRGAPVINDATMEDAKASGLDKLVRVVENGSDAPGTILEDCSVEFSGLFKAADLIISKGQGNYETLSGRAENIFFLMKIKCPVVAAHSGHPVGAHLLLENPCRAGIRKK